MDDDEDGWEGVPQDGTPPSYPGGNGKKRKERGTPSAEQPAEKRGNVGGLRRSSRLQSGPQPSAASSSGQASSSSASTIPINRYWRDTFRLHSDGILWDYLAAPDAHDLNDPDADYYEHPAPDFLRQRLVRGFQEDGIVVVHPPDQKVKDVMHLFHAFTDLLCRQEFQKMMTKRGTKSETVRLPLPRTNYVQFINQHPRQEPGHGQAPKPKEEEPEYNADPVWEDLYGFRWQLALHKLQQDLLKEGGKVQMMDEMRDAIKETLCDQRYNKADLKIQNEVKIKTKPKTPGQHTHMDMKARAYEELRKKDHGSNMVCTILVALSEGGRKLDTWTVKNKAGNYVPWMVALKFGAVIPVKGNHAVVSDPSTYSLAKGWRVEYREVHIPQYSMVVMDENLCHAGHAGAEEGMPPLDNDALFCLTGKKDESQDNYHCGGQQS